MKKFISFLFVFLLLIPQATAMQISGGPLIESIEYINTTIASNETVRTLTASTDFTAVDLTRSAIVVVQSFCNASIGDSYARATLTNGSTITITRGVVDVTALTVKLYLIQYVANAVKSRQAGNDTIIDTSQSVVTTLAPAVTANRSLVFTGGISVGNTANSFGDANVGYAFIDTPSQITWQRGDTTAAVVVSYTVIEFNDSVLAQ